MPASPTLALCASGVFSPGRARAVSAAVDAFYSHPEFAAGTARAA
jgi:hypothetical protein